MVIPVIRLVLFLILLPAYTLAEDLPEIFEPVLADGGHELLRAGNRITASNVDAYGNWLDETLAERIRKGEYEITLGRALNFPVHPRYVEATLEHAGKTVIGDEPGELLGYKAGRPFPELLVDDPQTGLKAAWNMRYAYAPDETETVHFIWRYKDMAREKLERTLKMYGAILRYKHRHSHDPIPEVANNPSNLYTALYLRVNYPQDIRNTQLLIHRLEDDTAPEQAWIYFNTQRRVKRIATGQKTDAFLGSDIMIEDFLGYNGRIRDQEWKFLGSKEMLLPMFAHNELDLSNEKADKDGYRDIPFGGKGACYPEVTWQLRKVHVVEAYPLDPSHPLSKRHYLIDAATFSSGLGRIYDKAGKLWKLAIPAMSHSGYHTPENMEWQGVITDGVTMIDLQAEHCTTLHLKTRVALKPLQNNSFTTAYLRKMGR